MRTRWTLLFVSHDRYFINRFATRIWEIADGTVTDWPMGFSQYRAEKAKEVLQKHENTKSVKEKSITEKPPRTGREQTAARKQLVICERHISETEALIEKLDRDMIDAACDYEKLNGLMSEKDAVQAALDELYEKWEALSEAAE